MITTRSEAAHPSADGRAYDPFFVIVSSEAYPVLVTHDKRTGLPALLHWLRDSEPAYDVGEGAPKIIGPTGIPSAESFGTAAIAQVMGHRMPVITGELNATMGEMTLEAHGHVEDPSDEVLIGMNILELGERVPDGEFVEAVTIPWASLARALGREPNLLYRFDARRFEEIVAAAYEEEGTFDEVILTSRSGDLGRDVIAIRHGRFSIRVLDQVKRYRPGTIVTADEVRSMYGVLAMDQKASKAYVTTTASFAPGVAAEFASVTPTRLDLRDGNALREWMLELARRRR